jgi:RNA polymerase sigma factor for flagellar operon FliA
MDWIPRSVRKDIHRIEEAMIAVRSKLGREGEDVEIAQELGVDIDTYHKMLARARGIGRLSLEEIMPDGSTPPFAQQASEGPSAFDELKIKETKEVIAQALLALSKKEQLVISLYYYDELTLKEIAEVLDLTESRICQIHSKAIIRLRTKLKSYHEG